MLQRIYYNEYGDIKLCAHLAQYLEVPTLLPEGCVGFADVPLGDIDFSTSYWHIEDEVIRSRVPAPSIFHVWKGSWEVDTDKLYASVKARRNQLLKMCDWTQIPDSPADSSAWAAYRQKLRDLPTTVTGNETSLEDVLWPTPPTT